MSSKTIKAESAGILSEARAVDYIANIHMFSRQTWLSFVTIFKTTNAPELIASRFFYSINCVDKAIKLNVTFQIPSLFN